MSLVSQVEAVHVRPATTDDVAALADVAAATFALACPPHVTSESVATFIREVLSPERFAAYVTDPQRLLFVAAMTKAMYAVPEAAAAGHSALPVALGYSMVVLGEPADAGVAAVIGIRPTAELSKIYVRPDAHGVGISHRLMAATLAAARDRGAAGTWLGVNQLNLRAQRFYGKSGFTRVGTKRFLVGDRYEDDYVYERAL